MSPTLRAKAGRFVNGRGFAYVAVVATLFFGVLVKSHKDSSVLRDAQVGACERGKLDRADNTRVYTAMATYYQGVVNAASVKADVKRIASGVRDELTAAAMGMKDRIIVCADFIDHHKVRPDEELLKRLPPLPPAP